MNIEDFLNPGYYVEYMREPINLRDRTIASNGYALLSIPKDKQYRDIEDMEDKSMAGKIKDVIDNLKGKEFKPMPEFELPDKTECSCCHGLGKATKEKCKECDGEGDVEFSTAYNYYSCDCKTCDCSGSEIIVGGDDDCPECNGAGSVFSEYEYVEIYGINIKPNILEIISKDPSIEVSALKEKYMLLFRSGVEEGLIMGVRVD